jgi:hypothetical protein
VFALHDGGLYTGQAGHDQAGDAVEDVGDDGHAVASSQELPQLVQAPLAALANMSTPTTDEFSVKYSTVIGFVKYTSKIVNFYSWNHSCILQSKCGYG